MKRHKLIQRLTAALVAGAMALSFCAPALAEAPSAAADPAAPAATASTAENSTADTIVFDQLYLGTQEDWAKTIADGSSGDVALQYTAADRTLTVTGTYFRALTISAPGVNVVLTGTTGPAVKGDLTITDSASVAVTSSAAGAQAVTGSTDITSDGAVSITGADRAVGGENLTVNAGGDVTIVGGCEGASIWHSASITTTGSVTLTTNNSGGWAQGTAGTGVLTVDAGGDVTITGGTASQPTINDATVRCGGEFELRNPAGGLVLCDKTSDGKSGNLHYYNTGATELVFRASSMGATCDVFQPGDSTVFGTLGDPSWITAKHEQDYQLTLTGCAPADSAQGRTVFYPGEEVHLVLKRPTNGTTFTGWTVTKEDGIAVLFEQEDDSIRFTMPACAVTAAANWEQATGQALWLSTEQDWIIVSKASLEAYPISGITYEDGAFVVDGFIVDDIKAAKTLRVLGLAPTEDERPDVVLKNLTVDTLIVDGVRDVTLDACRIGELDGYDHFDTNYSLQITNARDVVLANTSSRYSDISGVRNVTAKADDTLCDRLNIDCTGDIALSTAADTLGVACYLRAGGSIRLTGAPWKTLMVHSAQNATVDANALPQHASFTCSGIVDVSQRDGGAIVERDSGSPWYLLEYYPETEQPYVVTLNGETGEVRSDSYQLNNLDDLRAVQHLLITPASLLPDDVDSDAVGQFITDASGVLVSAALAGAAVWGGYEVTTRVMLKNLLPEGAAIPATRGELAQLLWNAAGRPEAGAVVTVYPDITDADQQAAARWCTEQGLLTARSDGTFAPDGRVPKWRVIEVWNHAFAK
ncbi:FapA family protein [Faecalibacterium wellingii]|uniref:FapA family protein n=1 Tax=Faecalibacterium wellingii TaxID=2929491 RepID=A0ABU3U1L4_9FIRM|nr:MULTISPECIES: FapA family protein [Faecalibacterium]MDU8689456.1 FapA family protein [Faecalibacterium prausnitzii]UQK56960.1 FapA family protein [Faecalibacterium sp. HTF-F]